MKKIVVILFCFCCICTCRELNAQTKPRLYRPFYHGKPWFTINTDHFFVHYQQENEKSAKQVATIAENIYHPITELYSYKPKQKTHIILNDRQDYSNGAAYFYDNIIEIWLSTLNTPLRGQHQWLHNVISHEFTHIIQIQSSMTRPPSVPFVYLQWLSYEKVRRRDQLLGFPNGVISYPISSVDIPAWWAEGTAQFQRENMHFDQWDSHRDMLLRTHILSSKNLSFNEMSHFSSKNSTQRELVYNQGWAFTKYLAYKFGEDIIPKINRQLRKNSITNIGQAIQKATKQKTSKLFSEWKNELFTHYQTMAKERQTNEIQTTQLTKKGSLNLYPIHREKYLAYLTNSNSGSHKLFLHLSNIENGNHQSLELSPINNSSLQIPTYHFFEHHTNHYYQCNFIHSNIGEAFYAPFSISHDQSRIAFSKVKRNHKGEEYNLIYIYNISTKKLNSIKNSTRMRSPIFTDNDTTIIAVKPQDGTNNVFLIDIKNKHIEQLTHFNGDHQIYKLVIEKPRETLILDMAVNGQRHIFRYNLTNQTLKKAFPQQPNYDYRDPFFDDKEGFIYYSSNKNGVFNIYRSIGDSPQEQITDVVGGAFMPNISSNQTLIYSEFSANGYQIMEIKNPLPITNPAPIHTPVDFLKEPNQNISFFFNKTDSLDAKIYRYRAQNTSFSLSPIILFDNYAYRYGSNSELFSRKRYDKIAGNFLRNIKLGVAFFSYEILPRLVISGSFSIAPLTNIPNSIGGFFAPSYWLETDKDFYLDVVYALPWGSSYSSPILEFEVINTHRFIDDAAMVQEFPCTSCLPDTLFVDASFNGWRIGLSLRSKISPNHLITLNGYFNSYTSEVQSFFSNEINQLIPKVKTNYFRSYSIGFDYDIELYKPYRHGLIAPRGFRGFLSYIYEPSSLLDRYILNQEEGDATIRPIYNKTYNHSVELRLRHGISLSQSLTVDIETRFFSYFNNPKDSFYHDYIGGVLFFRSYPFYSIGGNTTFFGRFSLSFPLWTNVNAQFRHILLDKIFMRLYAETGTAWRSSFLENNSLKIGIGAEIRMALISNHFLPTQVFFSTSYGLNTFNIILDDDFDTNTNTQQVSYGHNILFHFGVLFGFDFF